MDTISFEGQEQSVSQVAWKLWEQYIGACNSYLMPHGEERGNYLQRLHMLQESIRRCMRAEHESYLVGKATAGRVAETKGHAVLLGKIIAMYQRQEVV